MNEDEDYDVVIDVLQKHRSVLWKMTNLNMACEFGGLGIMDQIRLEQIDELDKAINMWIKNKYENSI
jgi:hypothetical protein